MKKSDLVFILTEAKRKLAAGTISQKQYDAFLHKMQERFLSLEITDPVWEKPRRPISKPRTHIRGAYRKHLHNDSSSATVLTKAPTTGRGKGVTHEARIG